MALCEAVAVVFLNLDWEESHVSYFRCSGKIALLPIVPVFHS